MARRAPAVGDAFKEHGIQRLALHLGNVEKNVGEDEAHDRDRERYGHVSHGAFSGLHLGFAQYGQAVAHGLQPCVGARAHAVGPQDEEKHAEHAELAVGHADVRVCPRDDRGQIAQVAAQAVDYGKGVGEHEDHEDGHQHGDGFFDPAHVEHDEQQHADDGRGELVRFPVQRQEAEQGVGPAGHGEGNGERVVHQERAAGDHAQRGVQKLARHHVAAASRGEEVDDLRVAGADDEDGEHRGQTDKQRQEGMLAEGQIGLRRAVARG